MSKLIAYCTVCGIAQGTFNSEGQLRLKIAEQKICKNCSSEFGFLSDGRIWNLKLENIQIDETEMDFWNIIHGSVVKVAKKKFEDGHFADAVESAFKEINKSVKDVVKKQTGDELDGADLMFKAFNMPKPIIQLSNLSTISDKNIQEGYMHIFAGSIKGIRNPKAHENLIIEREMAIHFIFLASLLMRVLDNANKTWYT